MKSEIAENNQTEISKIQDAESDTRNIKAQFIEEDDLQTVEQYQLAGFESNPPVGTKHLVIDLGGGWKLSHAENDGVEPDSGLDPGETKIYSSAGGTIQSEIICKKDGSIDIVAGALGKITIGNGTDEILDLFDQLLTKLQGNVDSAGASSTGTNSLINVDLALIQTALGNLKA